MKTGQIGMFGGPVVEPAPVDPAIAAIAARLPGFVRFGTSSWSFPGWEGRVWRRGYSDSLLANEGLGAYAAHPLLRTVSVDRSYYRMPDDAVFEAYAQQVPDDFRFVVKAPAQLTSGRLRGEVNPTLLDPNWADAYVYGPLRRTLGEKLGLVLLQFPPQATIPGFYDRLAAVLPPSVPIAVEVRNPAWMEGPLAQVLRDRGASPVLTLHPSMPDLRTQWKRMGAGEAPDLVVRWNLGAGQTYEDMKARYAPFDRVVDEEPALRSGIARAIDWALQRERPIWITANNKAEGCAPGTLEAIARVWAGAG